MGKWEKLFQYHILERGYHYYMSDHVYDLCKTETGYTAMVEGTEDYFVEIDIQDGSVKDMYCDCPYAAGGWNCKHMAAVLYKIEEENMESYREQKNENLKKEEAEIRSILSTMSGEQLRELLLQYAMANQNMRNDLLLKYAKSITEIHLNEVRDSLYRIAANYTNGYGYMDEDSVYSYICEVEEYIYEVVQKMLVKRHCPEAFRLVNEAYLNVLEQEDMEDYADDLLQMSETCFDLWKQILEKCNDEQKNMMQNEMNIICKNTQWPFLIREDMRNFLIFEFHDEACIKETMEKIDCHIDENLRQSVDPWDTGYDIEWNLLRRIQLMKELHYSEKEIKAYRKKYWEYPEIRMQEVDECIKKGDTRNAISILRESKKLDPDDSRMQRKYSELLIHMYDQSGQMQDYKQELMHFISSFWQNDLGYLLKLKEIMDGEEWIDYRENILEQMNGKFDRYELLAEEGLYERLMKEIMEEDFIYSMDRYEKVLKKRFPKKVRDVYLSYVQEQAKVVSNRKAYGKLMWYLKKLRTYPDGERITMEIAKEWKMKFRRRPAMMDELRKAGF